LTQPRARTSESAGCDVPRGTSRRGMTARGVERSTWNARARLLLVARARLVAPGLFVLGRVVRHHHHLAVAALADAHRRDALDVAQRHVNDAPLLRTHRLERHRPPGLASPLRRAVRNL